MHIVVELATRHESRELRKQLIGLESCDERGEIVGMRAEVANAATGEFKTTGVFDMAKTSAQAWTVGALIYWDDTNKVATNSSNTLGWPYWNAGE